MRFLPLGIKTLVTMNVSLKYSGAYSQPTSSLIPSFYSTTRPCHHRHEFWTCYLFIPEAGPGYIGEGDGEGRGGKRGVRVGSTPVQRNGHQPA